MADPLLVVGHTTDPVIEKLLGNATTDPEAVVYRWVGVDDREALVVAGSDDRGLMYALLELADRVEAEGPDALGQVEDTVETPDNEVRGIDRFIMGPVQDTWLYDEDFWHYYIQRLARNRFNRFVLIAGYDSAFMSPPYPFFVDVPGFPEVTVPDDKVSISREEHREVLRMIGRLCKEYGLDFFFGIWQQRPDWKEDQGELVEGLSRDPDELTEYCATGLERLLVAIPELDGLQLRVNFEAGVGGSSYDSGSGIGPATTTAEEFWREIINAVERASAERADPLKFDIRAKGLTDEMIRWALETGLDLTVPTKYWCESTGLPHHNTQMRQEELLQLDDLNRSRRYGHSDLLRKPRYYDVLYRLWVVGTNRIFVWGDPDYARRFAHSTQFGGATGFEVTAPLSLKGGHFHLQDENWPLFEDPELQSGDWEDERYWAWYLMFGRLGYSTETDSAVWERAFARRFGEAADAIQKGYRSASKILPLLTAAHLTEHPALMNWAELDTGGALFAEHNVNPYFGAREYYDGTYQDVEPSDPGLFYGINEYVRDALADDQDHKYTPIQLQRWYRRLAAETRDAVEAAEKTGQTGAEYQATKLDLLMLADLAEYHAEKTAAALALAFYHESEDAAYLPASRDRMVRAITAWESLAGRGEGTYHDDLVFGMGPTRADDGQWVDRLPELEADLDALEALIDDVGSDTKQDYRDPVTERDAGQADSFNSPSFDVDVPDATVAGEDLTLTVRTGDLNDHDRLRIRYRHTDQTAGAFEHIEMTKTDGGYEGTIPGEYIVPEWDLQVYFSTIDETDNGLLVPGLYHADEPAPYYVVAVTTE
ncbi:MULTISPECIES: hypothetical protein [unclassified Haladaptatus]|uniref:hypothetical protein n=1 Tax=unclassified Haladaptatus TaxID=2622732 RepID=UPI0023E76F5F|nr:MULTISPECIES: hypothetical protein [unclassified Haladaptatus]